MSGYGSGPARILTAAERLFGRHGIEGVSLREIAAAAGQANNSAVALHFGNKAGLLRAIVEARLPEIDGHRARRLEAAERDGPPSLKVLIECLLLAWIDDIDEDGEHPYANFMARLQYADETVHPLPARPELAPVTVRLRQEIRGRLHHLSNGHFALRLRLMASLFLGAVLHNGRIGFFQDETVTEQELLETLIGVIVAALEAPEFRTDDAGGATRPSIAPKTSKRKKAAGSNPAGMARPRPGTRR